MTDLNVLVAEKVMGWHRESPSVWTDSTGELKDHISTWNPTTNILRAIEVQAEMHRRGYWMWLTSPYGTGEPDDLWTAGFTVHGFTGWNERPHYVGRADNPALAICRAALRAAAAGLHVAVS